MGSEDASPSLKSGATSYELSIWQFRMPFRLSSLGSIHVCILAFCSFFIMGLDRLFPAYTFVNMEEQQCTSHAADSLDYGSDDDEEFSDGGWIQWFCSIEGHEFFAEVDEEYIRDNFNLYGLKSKINHYNDALDMILSAESPEEEELKDEGFLETYQDATDLYGLIHARFILSPRGQAVMREKFLAGRFGVCPRVMCERQYVLPIGLSEELRTSRVKIFCPKCEEVYAPRQKCTEVDGAYFGCSFPHVLLKTYADIAPPISTMQFIPRIYGFKVYGKRGSKYSDPRRASNK